jgi:hypothetical protein
MNAAEITFGIEIECSIPVDHAPAVGGYHHGLQIAGMPEGWNAQSDSSIHAARGFRAVEIVSPVLKGANGLYQVKQVVQWLNEIGARVNRSTGLHVHIGFDRQNEAQMKKLVTVVANFEKALYASTGTRAREQGCYCRPVANSQAHQEMRLDYVTRYHVLNVQTGRPTVEFRAFAGTLSYVKIVAHVRTCLGLVEKSLKIRRMPKWTAKTPVETSPIKRGGEGLTALNRLFYWLGWTKGREQYTFGLVTDAEVPTMDACKDTLVRLARKYDAQ